MQGWDVVWIGPDFTQANQIWQEEFRPRFGGHDRDLVNINENEKVVRFGNGAALHLRSNENIGSIRGLGKRLKGVIINEAAHFDLQYAWRYVIRPILVDNHGWAIIMSTTNSGSDGNADKLTPSYFNRLCEDIDAGRRKRGPGQWGHFSGTAFDNPALDPAEVRELVDEYDKGSIALDEEVYAKLLEGRHGTAFPSWRDQLHIVDRFMVPRHWRWAAGMDWGYRAPGCLVLFASSTDGDAIGVDEYSFNDGPDKVHAYDAGYNAGMLLRNYPMAEYIAADEQMWYETGSSGITLAEEFGNGLSAAYGQGLCPPLIEAVHGPHSRHPKFMLMQRMLSWKALQPSDPGYADLEKKQGVLRFEGGLVPPWHRPRLRFTDLCKACITTIPKLVYDPRTKKEDVDTTQNDHPYDAVTAYLVSRVPRAEEPQRAPGLDRHPGFSKTGRKKPGVEDAKPPKPWSIGRQRTTRASEMEPVD